MATQYTVKSNAAYDGTALPSRDVSTGSGFDLVATTGAASMSALHQSMITGSFYQREVGLESDAILIDCGPELGILSVYRDFPLSKMFASYAVRSELVSGTQRLRFCSKSDSRLTNLEGALQSCGFPIGGLTDANETSDVASLNAALLAAKVYMAFWRA